MFRFAPHAQVAALRGLALASLSSWCLGARPVPAGGSSLVFDPARFTVQSASLGGRTFSYRAYEGIVYVRFPVDTRYQSLNLYVPAEYYEGKAVGPYTAATAPIFLPNSVGGYLPGPPGGLGPGFGGQASAALAALSRGYVVAAPGARGRTGTDASGTYTGKAPAAIVDLKAAVRYLRANDARMPGTAEKIITNGTSAGGALSALLGATGNHRDYEPYLRALGAADARDDVFAVSAYCPITNLDHADAAYEWLLGGLTEYQPRFMPGPPPGPADAAVPAGAPPPSGPAPAPVAMDAVQSANAKLLKAQFPGYLDGLGLKTPAGRVLALDGQGNGSFRDHLQALVSASAQAALDAGADLSGYPWIRIQAGQVRELDFERYVQAAGRMKPSPAFDGLDLGTGENGLFGTGTVDARHFTRFGQEHDRAGGARASAALVKLMNPMEYIGTRGATVARFWRIRHGSIDRDTALAIPAILAARLQNAGAEVDFAIPWGVGHAGDYDLDELFTWMDQVCR